MAIVLQMAVGKTVGPQKEMTDKEKKKQYKRMSRVSPGNPEGKTKAGQIISKVASMFEKKSEPANRNRYQKKGGSVSKSKKK